MSFSGQLSKVTFEELLEWAEAGTKTGALELENERFRKVMYFIEGLLVGLNSTEPADSLAHRMQSAGLLSPTQADAADHVNRRTGRALVDVLHKTGAVGESELEVAIDEQVREAILAVFLWREGRFRFRDGEMPEELPAAVSFPVSAVIAEGRRRSDRARVVNAGLPGPDVPFRLDVEACGITVGSPLMEEVVALLERPQTVLSLQLLARAGEHHILEVVNSLVEQQAVAFVAGAALEAEALVAATRNLTRSTRLAAAAGTAAGASAGEAAGATVGVLEAAETTPVVPGLRSQARDLLTQARREMERKHYELAVDLFRQAEGADPADPRLPMLRAGAESVHSEALYRGELPGELRPVPLADWARAGATLDELSSELLRRMNGELTVRQLASGCGSPELEALIALRRLRRGGYIDLV